MRVRPPAMRMHVRSFSVMMVGMRLISMAMLVVHMTFRCMLVCMSMLMVHVIALRVMAHLGVVLGGIAL